MRGETETKHFRLDMLVTLNSGRNALKPHWDEMSLDELWAKFYEELLEVVESEGPAHTAAELVDLGILCMMLKQRITREVQ